MKISLEKFKKNVDQDEVSVLLAQAVIGFIDEKPEDGVIFNIQKVVDLLLDAGYDKEAAIDIIENDLGAVDGKNVFLWPN